MISLDAEKRKKISYAIAWSVILYSFLWIVYHFTTSNLVLHNTFRTTGKNLSVITGIFVHNDLDHIISNSKNLIFLGPVFFYYLGIRRGSVILLFISSVGNLLEIFTSELVEGYLNSRGVNISIFPRSAGISGSLSGMVIFIVFECTRSLKDARNQYNIEQREKGSFFELTNIGPVLYYVFYIGYPLYTAGERFVADLKAFSIDIINLMGEFESDWLSDLILWYAEHGWGALSGNRYLAHVWCILIALTLIVTNILIKRFEKRIGV